MGLFGWLDRFAGKVDRKLEPTAVALGTDNTPSSAAPVAVAEIEKEEAEAQEGEEA
jgi:hypothetical protein